MLVGMFVNCEGVSFGVSFRGILFNVVEND